CNGHVLVAAGLQNERCHAQQMRDVRDLAFPFARLHAMKFGGKHERIVEPLSEAWLLRNYTHASPSTWQLSQHELSTADNIGDSQPHPFPRRASIPSFPMSGIIMSPATGSAHHHPATAFRTNPP